MVWKVLNSNKVLSTANHGDGLVCCCKTSGFETFNFSAPVLDYSACVRLRDVNTTAAPPLSPRCSLRSDGRRGLGQQRRRSGVSLLSFTHNFTVMKQCVAGSVKDDTSIRSSVPLV